MAPHTALNSMLGSEGLDTMPEWPAGLAGRMSQVADGLFSSEPVTVSPSDLGQWQITLSELSGDFALCGFAGYGIQSIAFHLFLKQGPLILLMQTAWGGYQSQEDRAASASGAVGLANRFIELAESVQSRNRWPADQVLWIIDSDFSDSGCVWAQGTAPPNNLSAGVSVLSALNALEALLDSAQPS
ncbi:MAG: hypothetical protein ACKO8O_18860 [Betaproteobacteria bacterium]